MLLLLLPLLRRVSLKKNSIHLGGEGKLDSGEIVLKRSRCCTLIYIFSRRSFFRSFAACKASRISSNLQHQISHISSRDFSLIFFLEERGGVNFPFLGRLHDVLLLPVQTLQLSLQLVQLQPGQVRNVRIVVSQEKRLEVGDFFLLELFSQAVFSQLLPSCATIL